MIVWRTWSNMTEGMEGLGDGKQDLDSVNTAAQDWK